MPSVTILGGGYAGVRAARKLASSLDPTWLVTLVDRGTCHQLITRLPDLVAGTIGPERACLPLRRILGKRVDIIQAEVLDIDLDACNVKTSSGIQASDVLVVALGSKASFLDIPGAQEHCLVLKSVADAQRLRDKLGALAAGRESFRIVIIGAGYTGTEVAGMLSDRQMLAGLGARGHAIDITVLSQDSRLLPDGNPRLALVAERVLRNKGVKLILGKKVARIDRDDVCVESHPALQADVVIWAARTQPSLPPSLAGVGRTKDGRLAVDSHLRFPLRDHAYAVGDVSAPLDYLHGGLLPASAQLAIQEGDLVADNIGRIARGRPLREFRPRILGEALSLGRDHGAAEVAGIVLEGNAAVAVKNAALSRYLLELGGAPLLTQYA